jgi:hypothetical protein
LVMAVMVVLAADIDQKVSAVIEELLIQKQT